MNSQTRACPRLIRWLSVWLGGFTAALAAATAAEFSGEIFALATRTNGQVLVGGAFTNFNNTGSQFVARLNADGSLDNTFSPTPGPNGHVHAVAFQSDGKILIGGGFVTVNGAEHFNLARLNADGSLDPRFDLFAGGVDGTVLALSVLGTNQIYLAGEFTVVGGSLRPHVARLRGNGTVDTRFDPLGFGANDTVRALAVQPDGKVLIAGDFTMAALRPRSRVARLALDGLADAEFDPGVGPDGIVRALALQPDGKIFIAGDFLQINGRPRARLARLNADGSLDESFDPGQGADDSIRALARQADGRILIGGRFNSYDQQRRNFLARLSVDGSLDASFDLAAGANAPINTLTLPNEGRLLLGGEFTVIHNEPHAYFALLTNVDHSAASQIEFVARDFSVGEKSSLVVVSLMRTGDTASAATVDYATAPGSAIANVDFTPQSGAVFFAAGETRQTISLVIKNDARLEGAEIFYVILSQPTGNAALGSRGAARIRLADDEVARAGDVDPGFNAMSGADGAIEAMTIQPDGALVLAGDFLNVNALTSPLIARLNANGSFDTFFDTGTGPDAPVLAVALQNESSLLIAGDFASVDGVSRSRIAQLLPDGRLDFSFDPGAGANDAVMVIATNSDRRILIGGTFTEYDGVKRSRVAQLFGGGELDPTFDAAGAGFNHAVRALALTADGKILTAGDFTYAGSVPRSHVAQLNADGSLDDNFDPGSGTDGVVSALVVQPDGNIVIAGDFQSYNGIRRARLARLHADGSLDENFNPGEGPDAVVRCLLLQTDGNYLVGGEFVSFSGLERGRFARINANGSLDTAFDSGGGADAAVNALVVNASQAFIAGAFTHVNGLPRDRLASIFTTGATPASQVEFVAPQFSAPASNGLATVVVRRTGKVDVAATALFTTRDGTAVAGIDYFTQVSVLNFAPGETNKTISVFLRRDTPGRGNRVVNLLLASAAGGAGFGSQGTAMLAITDEPPVFAGSVDVGFDPVDGLLGEVFTVAPLPGGTVLVGGSFSNSPPGGTNLKRLNRDGSLDTSFDPGSGANGPVRAIALLSDGRAVIGGGFTTYAGAPRNFLARVQPDGALDGLFDPGSRLDTPVHALAVQADDRVIIGGDFQNFGGVARSGIARLKADASLDLSFDPGSGANGRVRALVLQADEKAIVAGEFTAINNFPRAHIARLNRDGSLDASFDPGTGTDAPVLALALRADGALWLAGEFAHLNDSPRKFIARLTANGALDVTFDPGASADARILALAALPDGRVLIGGDFTNYAGMSRAHVARLLENGIVDECFISGTGTDASVNSMAVDSAGAVVMGGAFRVVDGFRRPAVARLLGDPPLDSADLFIMRLQRRANGDIQFSVNTQRGRCYLIEASTNLFDWQLLASIHASGTNLDFEDVDSRNLPRRFYRVRR